jgi:hypothetical protein
MEIPHLEQLEGISASRKPLLSALMSSIEVASKIQAELVNPAEHQVYRMVMSSALQTVNALLTAANAQCTLAPPPANIDMVPDNTGALIYCCEHPKPHRWNLKGERI